MQLVRRYLRNVVAGWLALEAGVGIAIAVALAFERRFTEAVVLLILVALFGALSWRLALRRGRRRSTARRDTA